MNKDFKIFLHSSFFDEFEGDQSEFDNIIDLMKKAVMEEIVNLGYDIEDISNIDDIVQILIPPNELN